ITKEIISDRTGLTISEIDRIEKIDKNVSLLKFLSYCNSINVLEKIAESISYKYDEIGNRLIMKELKKSGRKYV
nr:hypothetical protein [Desulfovibrio sp.]